MGHFTCTNAGYQSKSLLLQRPAPKLRFFRNHHHGICLKTPARINRAARNAASTAQVSSDSLQRLPLPADFTSVFMLYSFQAKRPTNAAEEESSPRHPRMSNGVPLLPAKPRGPRSIKQARAAFLPWRVFRCWTSALAAESSPHWKRSRMAGPPEGRLPAIVARLRCSRRPACKERAWSCS